MPCASIAEGRATMGNPMGNLAGRRTLDSSLEGLSGVLNHLRSSLGESQTTQAANKASSNADDRQPASQASASQASVSQASVSQASASQAASHAAPEKAAPAASQVPPSEAAPSQVVTPPAVEKGQQSIQPADKVGHQINQPPPTREKLKVPTRAGLSAEPWQN